MIHKGFNYWFKFIVISSLSLILFILLYNNHTEAITGDAAWMHYFAYLTVNHDYVVYKDIISNNLPSTIYIHQFIGYFFGYLSSSLTYANYVFICLIVVFTIWGTAKREVFSKMLGLLIFLVLYLYLGTYYYLEREIFIIFFLAALLNLKLKPNNSKQNLALCLTLGVVAGLIVFVKPQYFLLPVIIMFREFFLLHKSLIKAKRAFIFNFLSPFSLGVSLIFFIYIFKIYENNSLDGFIIVIKDLLPAYKTYMNFLAPTFTTIAFSVKSLVLIWFFGIIGFLLKLKHSVTYKQKINNLSLTVICFLTLLINYFFSLNWEYQYLVVFFMGSLGTGLLIEIVLTKINTTHMKIGISFILISLISINIYAIGSSNKKAIAFENSKSKAISTLITQYEINSKEIQFIGTTGSVLNAMMIHNLEPASAVVSTIPLQILNAANKNHIYGDPFIENLEQGKVKYVIVAKNLFVNVKVLVKGLPELESTLHRHFTLIEENDFAYFLKYKPES